MEAALLHIAVAKELGLPAETAGFAADRQLLIKKVNDLIVNDFEKLVSILYRMDVSEAKINSLLKEFMNEDAAAIIVDLMLEREAEKIKTRRSFERRDNNISDEEKW